MRPSRGLVAGLIAVAVFTSIAPAADAFPRFRIVIRPIEVPSSSAGSLSDDAATTLRRIRRTAVRLRLQHCLTGATTDVLKGSSGAYLESGELQIANDAVSGAAIGCMSSSASSHLPNRGAKLVGSAIANQVLTAVGDVDLDSSAEVPIEIDLDNVAYETTGDSGEYSPPSGYSSGGGDSPWPIVAVAGGLFLAALVVRSLIRRR